MCVVEKTQAYRPPQARGGNYTATKLHEFEPASNIRQAQADSGKPASKNKKKRDARKAKANEVVFKGIFLVKLKKNVIDFGPQFLI